MRTPRFLLLAVFLIASPDAAWTKPLCECEESAEQLFHVINAYRNAEEEADRAEVLPLLEQVGRRYKDGLEKALRAHHVSFEMVETDAAAEKEYGRRWSFYRITPGDSSKLNLLARSLRQNLGVSLALDPLRLRFHSGRAGYSSRDNELYVGEIGFDQEGEDFSTAHEIVHAELDAQRKGKLPFDDAYPVHVTFRSAKPVDTTSPVPMGYSRAMSFEELVTHGVNLEMAGPQGAAKEWARLREVSRYAEVVSQQASQLLATDKNVSLEKSETGLPQLKVVNGTELAVEVFLPPEIATRPKRDAIQYARRVFADAIKLAQFNAQAFADAGKEATELAAAAATFRRRQEAYIAQSLAIPSPTKSPVRNSGQNR